VQRQERVEAFQRGEGDAFLISLKAGGTGLNLTAADYVIHMDPWWNPAVEDQATDRAHRIGQTKPVMVYRIIARGTIEEQILQMHGEKRDLVDSVLTGADSAAKLSTQDLADMIRQGVDTTVSR
jgi:SNF2 family DNA or RNA helicase